MKALSIATILSQLRAVLFVLFSGSFCFSGSAFAQSQSISGQVHLPEKLVVMADPTDRLIIKLYHPEKGILKDLTFRIFRTPTFPFRFKVSPGRDMSKRTKWQRYVVEASLDKDNNPAVTGPAEPSAKSDGLVPLGTEGLQLILQKRQ